MLVITAAAAPPLMIINGVAKGEHLARGKDLMNSRCSWLFLFLSRAEPAPLGSWAPGWSLRGHFCRLIGPLGVTVTARVEATPGFLSSPRPGVCKQTQEAQLGQVPPQRADNPWPPTDFRIFLRFPFGPFTPVPSDPATPRPTSWTSGSILGSPFC